jgi:hypothetical protein
MDRLMRNVRLKWLYKILNENIFWYNHECRNIRKENKLNRWIEYISITSAGQDHENQNIGSKKCNDYDEIYDIQQELQHIEPAFQKSFNLIVSPRTDKITKRSGNLKRSRVMTT